MNEIYRDTSRSEICRTCGKCAATVENYAQRLRGYFPSAIIFSMAAISAGLSSL